MAHSMDKGNRKFLMGHNQNSKIFDQYESRTSVIDFQSIACGLTPTENVHHMGGMSIRRREDVPKVLSKAGFNTVMTDIRITKAFDKRLTAFQRVYHRFGLAKKPGSLTVEVTKLKVLSEIKDTLTGILDVIHVD